LDANVDISRTWENVRENIKMSAEESLCHQTLKQHKTWVNKECSKLLHQRKQAKVHWLQNQSQIIGNNVNNVRHETSRHFRNRKRNQPRTNFVKDENGYLAGFHSILNMSEDYFCDVRSVNYMGLLMLGRPEYMLQPLVSESSSFWVEIAIESLERFVSLKFSVYFEKDDKIDCSHFQ
jgi:hypothetical protein